MAQNAQRAVSLTLARPSHRAEGGAIRRDVGSEIIDAEGGGRIAGVQLGWLELTWIADVVLRAGVS